MGRDVSLFVEMLRMRRLWSEEIVSGREVRLFSWRWRDSSCVRREISEGRGPERAFSERLRSLREGICVRAERMEVVSLLRAWEGLVTDGGDGGWTY
jgi:hypothetical protein